MPSAAKSVVTFSSERFNASVVRPYFLNPMSFGDDVAQHLSYELQRLGHTADEPAQEDFGWYFRFSVGGKRHLFVVGRRPVEGDWLGSIERIPFLFLKRPVDRDASLALHAALADGEVFHDVRWHDADAFDAGREDEWSAEP
jgi:hypothetical protein